MVDEGNLRSSLLVFRVPSFHSSEFELLFFSMCGSFQIPFHVFFLSQSVPLTALKVTGIIRQILGSDHS